MSAGKHSVRWLARGVVVCHWENTFGRDAQFIASPAPTDWITQGNYHKSQTRFTFHFKETPYFYTLRAVRLRSAFVTRGNCLCNARMG